MQSKPGATMLCLVSLIVSAFGLASQGEAAMPNLVFSCSPDNDLYVALQAAGRSEARFDTAGEAVAQAKPGATVLILADGYPEATTRVDAALLDEAAGKALRLYIEYPGRIPGLTFDAPRETVWERAVVASDVFGSALPRLRILQVNGCRVVPTTAEQPWLVLGRVAGFDRALFGLPKETLPLLFELPQRRLVVATTKLSGFVTGRYGPSGDWRTLWEGILAQLAPGAKPPELCFTPPVRPAYGRSEALPASIERLTLAAAAQWYKDSRLLVHPDEEAENHRLLKEGAEEWPLPDADSPQGDGSCGIREGYASAIDFDGRQGQRTVIRADCNAETAMCLALDGAVHRNERSRKIARNLLDYVFCNSGTCRGVRGDPAHPAFGHVAWGEVSPAWTRGNYGDDNARVIQAAILAAAALESDRWDEPILRALLANLRTTGKFGFRGDRIDIPDLESRGWKHYEQAETINVSPHFESGLWACYLWAYRQTQYRPFLDKAKGGIRRTMEAYPEGWRWQSNVERARMMLCLAWLVGLEDTAEHRDWLKRVADDLLVHQEPCGAIATLLVVRGTGHYMAPTCNEDYGTRETPLTQEEGDPVSEQLYTTGFALFGLREAVAIAGDPELKRAEDRLAEYLCRIQVRSEQFPYLNGGWFRAFDYGRWDYWASSADAGWGAWCMEAGWGPSWTAAALALRIQKTSLWELSAGSDIGRHLDSVQALMARNAGGPWEAGPQGRE